MQPGDCKTDAIDAYTIADFQALLEPPQVYTQLDVCSWYFVFAFNFGY
jgi:hypothetical protein